MKVLNLYSGIGGNRKLWEDVEVTAVELDPEVAKVYQDYFPDDTVIIGDAHQYLLDHYKEFDFIWTSPPCPTHSRINFSQVRELEYPDMRLYQEVIFLKTWCKCKWVVENVIPYYEPLIPCKQVDKHVFWSNFNIGNFQPSSSRKIRSDQIPELQKITGFDLSGIDLKGKRQKLRNCVHPETGLYIFECARGVINSKSEQTSFF